jgi:23S rRNA (pseudouridine1915-N3)-methyltransferase
MDLIIIWPGKIKNIYLNQVAAEYCNKIKKMIRFQLIQIKESKHDAAKRLKEEKKLIKEKIPDYSYKIVLDMKGKQLGTMEWVKIIKSLLFSSTNKHIVFIGGSHNGLDEEIKSDADLLLGLSPLELPHELSRVVLLEQIYRVLCYINKIPYPK